MTVLCLLLWQPSERRKAFMQWCWKPSTNVLFVREQLYIGIGALPELHFVWYSTGVLGQCKQNWRDQSLLLLTPAGKGRRGSVQWMMRRMQKAEVEVSI